MSAPLSDITNEREKTIHRVGAGTARMYHEAPSYDTFPVAVP